MGGVLDVVAKVGGFLNSLSIVFIGIIEIILIVKSGIDVYGIMT